MAVLDVTENLMANYYATTRSNYFHVKDREAFDEFCSRCCHVTYEGDDDTVMVSADNGDCGGWPCYDMENDEDLDFPKALSAHLAEGEVAILMEVGSEKLRYLWGQSIAVRSDGEIRETNLNDIYKLAEELTDKPVAQASY